MQTWISYSEPMIRELKHPIIDSAKIKVLVRLEGQNHPQISGNKWWKLKYNLRYAIEQKFETILTFGGAYSNHIYATAAACKVLGLASVGIIRGEKSFPLNTTLQFAEESGMRLEYMSRSDYKNKSDPHFIESLHKKFGRCIIITEGGTNNLAVDGCEELGKQILKTDFDYLCLPVGTGGTIAGLIKAFDGDRKIIGIPVLKDNGFLNDVIQNLLPKYSNNWELLPDYHHGGYAKTNTALNEFILEMASLDLHTEHVYSGKLFWAVFDLIKKNFFSSGSTIMILHTGGVR